MLLLLGAGGKKMYHCYRYSGFACTAETYISCHQAKFLAIPPLLLLGIKHQTKKQKPEASEHFRTLRSASAFPGICEFMFKVRLYLNNTINRA
jgi:hypothetical protein